MGKEFMGRGWKFPVQVDEATGRVMTCEYEEDIDEAIRIILNTVKGERIMRPDFGCGMQNFIFGLSDATTIRLLETDIRDSIQAWEPRVGDVEVKARISDTEAGMLILDISYVVRSTNNRYNMVFPFMITEGNK